MPAETGGSIQARLTRKLGPLPVWAWAAIIVGAAIAYSHFHAKSASGATTQDTGQPAMAAGGVDTGAGAGAAGGSGGFGGPMDNFSQDQLSALEASLGGFTASLGSLQASVDSLAAIQSTSNFTTTDTAQSTGGGTATGAVLIASPPVVSTSGATTQVVTSGVSAGGDVVTGASPPVVAGAGLPAPQSKISQVLSSAGVGGNPGSAGFVTPITVPTVMTTFAMPTSKLAPGPVASSTSAVHKKIAV